MQLYTCHVTNLRPNLNNEMALVGVLSPQGVGWFSVRFPQHHTGFWLGTIATPSIEPVSRNNMKSRSGCQSAACSLSATTPPFSFPLFVVVLPQRTQSYAV